MRRIFFPGIVIFSAGTLLCAVSPSVPLLIGFRLLQGIGNAMIFATAVATLSALYPPGERGAVLGLSVALSYIGLSAGPLIGGVLTQHLGWRSVFACILPFCVPIILLLLSDKREWTERFPQPFDLAGAVLYGLVLLILIYGLSLLPAPEGFFWIASCIPVVALFIAREMRNESPILDLRLFLHNRVFAFSSIATLINYAATFAVGFLLALYLQYNRGLDPQAAGVIIAAQPVVQAVFSPAAGRLSDRLEPRILASVGMALSAAGLFLLALLTETTPIPSIIAVLFLLGLGFAFFSSPNTNAVMSSVGGDALGIASATVATARQVGMMLSLGITMVILSVIIGRVQITPAYQLQLMESVQVAFALFAILCLAGISFSLARGRVRKEGQAGGGN